MIAARTIVGPAYPEIVGEMERELNNVIEDFYRAVYADETSKLSISQSVDS